MRSPMARLLVLAALMALAACSSEIGTPGEPLRLLDPSLPNAVLNEPYNETLLATGGLRPYTFALEGGALPPGILLAGGTLRGTPSELGSFEFSVAVSDANLAKTFETYTVTVIEVPPPTIAFEPPLTEVQAVVTLRARVSDARGLRALRTVLSYDGTRFSLAPDSVVTSRGDLALFTTAEAGRVAVDVAFLGGAFDGEAELFRLDLVPTETGPLFVSSETEFLSAAGHHYTRLDEGTRPATPAEPDDAPPDDGASPPANDGVPEGEEEEN